MQITSAVRATIIRKVASQEKLNVWGWRVLVTLSGFDEKTPLSVEMTEEEFQKTEVGQEFVLELLSLDEAEAKRIAAVVKS